LIYFRGKKIERCENAPVWTQVISLHDFFIVDRVANVDVRCERHIQDRRVEVHYIWGFFLPMEMCIYSLHESGFAGT
jgi:hypothetical protein